MNLFKEKELEVNFNFFKTPVNKNKSPSKITFGIKILNQTILAFFLVQTIFFINYSSIAEKDYQNTLNSYQETIDLMEKTKIALKEKNNDVALTEFVKLKNQSTALADIMSGAIILNILNKKIENESLNKGKTLNTKNDIEREKLVTFYKQEWNSAYLKETKKLQIENDCLWIDLTCNMFLTMKKNNNRNLLQRINKTSQEIYYNVTHQKEYANWHRKLHEKEEKKETLTIEDFISPGKKMMRD